MTLPFDILKLRKAAPAAPAALDTQTVNIAQSGTAGASDRLRGFISGSLGSISDGTSNIFAGGAITQMNFEEDVGEFYLTINGSTNTGWTNLNNVTDGTTLTRAAATYSGDTWTWSGQTIAGFFAGSTGAKTITFT